jgi:hypothetical protein
MMLISSNEQLLTLIPNTLTTAKGEVPLYDKMVPFLSATEEWLADNITSEAVLTAIGDLEVSHPTRILTCQIIAYDAFYRAIPQLDVILTPNGFGIVSNSNIAPASKERIERLMASLLEHRDRLLMQMMTILPAISGWTESEQGRFFSVTMFPNLEVTLRFPKSTESRWEKFLALREAAIPVEEFFAKQYLSKELLEVLRSEVLTRQFRSETHRTICRMLQAIEMRCLSYNDPSASMHFQHGDLSNIVNTIRNNPEEFPEWHSSPTAELYNPAIFENKKESKGYWF